MRSLFNEGSYEHSNPWTIIIIILKMNMRHLVILIVLGLDGRGFTEIKNDLPLSLSFYPCRRQYLWLGAHLYYQK